MNKLSILTKPILLICLLLILSIETHGNNNQHVVNDPFCRKFAKDGTCLECSDRYFRNINTGKCTQVSDLCATWDKRTGRCLTCYPGYTDPIDGVCGQVESSDNHCAEYGWWKGNRWMDKNEHGCKKVCKRCEDGYYLDENYQCQLITIENCQYAYPNGTCKKCKSGYDLDLDGNCVVVGSGRPCKSLNLCLSINSLNNTCNSCVFRSYLDENRCCIEINGYCKQWKSNGVCTSCYLGYKVNPTNPRECILG